ncbi:MAG: hypothetical protein AB7G28_20935 [Pirellulales bacterium]
MRKDRGILGLSVRRQMVRRVAVAMLVGSASLPAASQAAVTSSSQHGLQDNSFNSLISNTDLIQGRQTVDEDVFENPVDSLGNPVLPGWHPANTNPADQLAAFTDGLGINPTTNLSGLLNDANVDNPSGYAAKVVQYPFTTPVDIGKINIFTGNRLNADSRVFASAYIEYSTNGGSTFQPLGYFRSDPSGTINDPMNPASTFNPAVKSTMLSIYNDASPTMASGVTDLVINLYAVGSDIDELSPTRGIHGDHFDGVNPLTGVDDGIRSAFVSPLVFEIDVLPPSAPVVGDYNGNGKVDAADYTKWRDTLNANVANGTGADGSGNGVIDQADYNIWKTSFGNGGAGAAANVVPEPATAGVIAVALFAVLGLRWRTESRGHGILNQAL